MSTEYEVRFPPCKECGIALPTKSIGRYANRRLSLELSLPEIKSLIDRGGQIWDEYDHEHSFEEFAALAAKPVQSAGPLYLVYSREHNAWWKDHGGGYTRHEWRAGRYSREGAERICDEANRYLRNEHDGPNEFFYLAPEVNA